MNGLGVFMLIFAVCLFFAGLYVFCGHNSELLLWKGYNKNRTKEELRVIGGITMLVSLIPLIVSILAFIFDIQ